MERPAWAPQGIDISMPGISRMYGNYLGGSRNFEVDGNAAPETMGVTRPGIPRAQADPHASSGSARAGRTA